MGNPCPGQHLAQHLGFLDCDRADQDRLPALVIGRVHGAALGGGAGLAAVADVDVAELYDCFTITVIVELEDLGFCPKGEGGRFVADGQPHLAPDHQRPDRKRVGVRIERQLGAPMPLGDLVEALRADAVQRAAAHEVGQRLPGGRRHAGVGGEVRGDDVAEALEGLGLVRPITSAASVRRGCRSKREAG